MSSFLVPQSALAMENNLPERTRKLLLRWHYFAQSWKPSYVPTKICKVFLGAEQLMQKFKEKLINSHAPAPCIETQTYNLPIFFFWGLLNSEHFPQYTIVDLQAISLRTQNSRIIKKFADIKGCPIASGLTLVVRVDSALSTLCWSQQRAQRHTNTANKNQRRWLEHIHNVDDEEPLTYYQPAPPTSPRSSLYNT